MPDAEEVVVAPFTTRPPGPDGVAIEVPARVRAHLGLDAERSWISIATLNRFVWPGPDIRAIPGRTPRTAIYGYIPQRLLDTVRTQARSELAKRAPSLVVRRDE